MKPLLIAEFPANSVPIQIGSADPLVVLGAAIHYLEKIPSKLRLNTGEGLVIEVAMQGPRIPVFEPDSNLQQLP